MKLTITGPVATLPDVAARIDMTRCHYGRCGSSEVEFKLLHDGKVYPYCGFCASDLADTVPTGTLIRIAGEHS